jgi:hypothetical protein
MLLGPRLGNLLRSLPLMTYMCSHPRRKHHFDTGTTESDSCSTSASTSPIRVTSSGNASLFNGVPDWIYEEEVFSNDHTLWWSPDSSKIAFLRLDETEVDEFRFPIYNPTDDSSTVVPYTQAVVIKYPKPGYNNPLTSVHVFDVAQYLEGSESSSDSSAKTYTYELTWEDRFPVTNSVIMDVSWVGQSTLIVKEVTRAADNGSVVYFNLTYIGGTDTVTGKVIRRLGSSGEEGDEGWIQSVRRNIHVMIFLSENLIAEPKYLPSPRHAAFKRFICLSRYCAKQWLQPYCFIQSGRE